jgi:GT2 family glycosyltransferase/glycosyltransferase involved in cell wall biosynthesis/SAM-dependent methyltransferase
MSSSSLFDRYYYEHGCGRPYERDEAWLNFFDGIAKRIIEESEPKTVLDAGCALGFLVEAFRNRGIDAFGVDISTFAIENVYTDIKPYCWIGSICEPFPQKYDLITSIEVLEHLSQQDSEKAIANLCAHADEIIFSSTPFDYKESTHFNVQPPEYWAEQFSRYGFYRDLESDMSFITPWAVKFIKINRSTPRLVREYERKFWYLWKENTDLRSLSSEMRQNLSEQADQLKQLAARVEALSAESNSHAWKLVFFLRKTRKKFLPPDSKREKLARRAYSALKIWRVGGMKKLIQRVMERVALRTGQSLSDYKRWILDNEPKAEQLAEQRMKSSDFNFKPLISVIVPVWNTPVEILKQTIRSVIDQTYPYWELCLVDGNSSTLGLKDMLTEIAQTDSRVYVRFLERNLGISGNSNEALRMAQGEFVALLDHDDLLAPNMLYEVISLLNQHPDADLIYFDEDKISGDGQTRNEPWFKPQRWSPDLLLSTNYFMHAVYRRTLVQDIEGFNPAMDGAQDWDLALRCAERTQQIYHIPHVLYHWRQLPGSAASAIDAKPWAFDAQVGCIQNHLQRLGVQNAQVISPSLGQVRVLWPTTGAKVSIIIPTRDKVELLRPCLTSILTLTSYPNFEIILVDTGSTHAETHRYYEDLATEPRIHIIKFTGPFNYSVVNNFGAAHAAGELLLFLNNDTQILETDWLTELAGWVERPEVGVVGCKLIRPHGDIQHAGIIMGLEGHGSHVFEGNQENHYGPFGSSEWYRDYYAVTGACLMMRRAVFQQVEGFDSAYQIGYGDIDLCLRTVEAGYRVVYTPFARILHHEGGTRGLSLPASDVLRASCKMFSMIQAGDPFYNPNLSYNNRETAISIRGEENRTDRLFRILKHFDLINLTPQVKTISSVASPIFAYRPASELTKKLLLVAHDLSLSGAPLILYHLARYLAQNGFTITVLSSKDGPLRELYNQVNIKVIVEPTALDDARVLPPFIIEHGVVLVNTILAWRAVHAARAFERPCLWWIHEAQYGQQMAFTKHQVTEAFAIADKIIFPAKATAALYAAFCASNNQVCIHTGLDTPTPGALPHGFEKKPEKFYVVNIASVENRKGQDVLLASIAMLPGKIRSQFEVYIVGRILERKYYRTLSKRFKRQKNIHFIGEVPHTTALAYLQIADVFVLSSRDEVLPVTLLEAMSLGKGIIASRVGGIAEVVDHGVNGILVEPENARAMAQNLELVYRDREHLTQLSHQARNTFTERLTLNRFGQEFNRLLAEVVDQVKVH